MTVPASTFTGEAGTVIFYLYLYITLLTLPDLRQRVQTLTLLILPSMSAFTRWRLGAQVLWVRM